MKKILSGFALLLLSGCATGGAFGKPLDVPSEFNQPVILAVADNYEMHQAPLSSYDVGDLQNFHSQHTLPVLVEDAFKQIFPDVRMYEKGPKIETQSPDVPAIFEVKFLDIANDTYSEADTYRGEATIAVAMKSPRGNIFWQKAFRGKGFVQVDPQYSTGLGPQDALVDAVRNAIDQMQKAIIASPEVRNQLKYYKSIEAARPKKDVSV